MSIFGRGLVRLVSFFSYGVLTTLMVVLIISDINWRVNRMDIEMIEMKYHKLVHFLYRNYPEVVKEFEEVEFETLDM